MTGQGVPPGNGDSVMAELREHVRRLVNEVGGPLRQVRLRSGGEVLEVEWHEVQHTSSPAVSVAAVVPAPQSLLQQDAPEDERTLVTSPIVGTFYRAPEPGAANFVEVGDVVEAGQPVGIVEAMKLMNHIVAERAGVVAEVIVANGKPVEFEQPLIVLVPE